jgi:hypothetical protein
MQEDNLVQTSCDSSAERVEHAGQVTPNCLAEDCACASPSSGSPYSEVWLYLVEPLILLTMRSTLLLSWISLVLI